MIRNTFTIFTGIGARIERHLWHHGVLEWEDFLARESIPGFSAGRKAALDAEVSAAAARLDQRDASFFPGLLGQSGAWRLWNTLADEAVCLDIETDGRSATEGEVTVAGFYSHGEYRPYVLGRNLTLEALRRELSCARLLVTYFGTGFDLPYLKTRFPGLEIDAVHFDLCHAGHKVGLKGGLKTVERIVGIQRPGEVEGMSGYEAVLLWQSHLRGDGDALGRLVGYNREDTVNLHALAWIIYEKMREATGLPGFIAGRAQPEPAHPKALDPHP